MLTITLLGTAATMPLPDRALTAAVAECGGHSLLFDCGEGTQTAARRAGVNLMKLDAICLTHYHGDHTETVFFVGDGHFSQPLFCKICKSCKSLLHFFCITGSAKQII